MSHSIRNLRLFFADTSPADKGDTTLQKYEGQRKYFKGPWLWVFIEQIINSAIVGGIAALSSIASGGSYKGGLIGFGLTFLLELRKYRQLAGPGPGP